MAADYAWDLGPWYWTGLAGLLGGSALVGLGQERTYRSTSVGLERGNQVARTLLDWDAFDGYAVTEEMVVVSRRAPWRPSIRLARADLDDEDAVLAALDERLPRR